VTGYDSASFWQTQLSSRFDLIGVGHAAYGSRYNEFLYRAKLRGFDRALATAGVSIAGASVLDVGCGIGVFAEHSLGLGCRSYTGVDITTVAVERLRRRYPELRFEVADIGRPLGPELGSPRYDVVYCLDVLYHVVDQERFERAVENLWSLVAPGGHLVLVDALWKDDVVPRAAGPHVPHVRFHRRADYERMLIGRHDARVVAEQPLYVLFNRPIVGSRWPWTRERLSWHLRYRVFEWTPVLAAMYALDGVLTRVRRNGPDLKLVVIRKERS
jgi:SAM-dependent methyltransferase